MIKSLRVTKKFSILFSVKSFKSSFTLIGIFIDKFIDYQLVFSIFNVEIIFHYVNKKQRIALEKLRKELAEMESEFNLE
jgi:hypothetical protein